MLTVLQVILALMVMAAAVVSLICAGFALLAVLSPIRSHYAKAAPYFPRTAVLVPAHNEAAVLEAALEAMLSQDYPAIALRVVVIDDASIDRTGQVVAGVAARHPGQVELIRRERGGEGKAAVLNDGLKTVLANDWAEAILIMDADVIFDHRALRSMTRHLADPTVGVVGGYVKEGSRPGNSLSRFVGIEYVFAQALARRAANVMGVFGCVPGGAQLHSRQNLVALNGRIDDSTKAEDTVTTLLTQLDGRSVVFDGHAVCWAEEPETIEGLWAQRLRWARGNLQITAKFKSLWFRRTTPVGRWSFGQVWFAVTLQPVLMVFNTAALVVLFFTDYGVAGAMLRLFWITNALCWVVTAVFGLLIDRETARRCWLQCLTFPGLVSLVIIVLTLLPTTALRWANDALRPAGASLPARITKEEVLFAALWTTGCMLVALAARWIEGPNPLRRWMSSVLLYLGGYGPLLCAVSLNAYIDELRDKEARWEVTVKTGRMQGRGGMSHEGGPGSQPVGGTGAARPAA